MKRVWQNLCKGIYTEREITIERMVIVVVVVVVAVITIIVVIFAMKMIIIIMIITTIIKIVIIIMIMENASESNYGYINLMKVKNTYTKCVSLLP